MAADTMTSTSVMDDVQILRGLPEGFDQIENDRGWRRNCLGERIPM
jgi:hypothetical protein